MDARSKAAFLEVAKNNRSSEPETWLSHNPVLLKPTNALAKRAFFVEIADTSGRISDITGLFRFKMKYLASSQSLFYPTLLT